MDREDSIYLVKGTVIRANARILAETGRLEPTLARMPAESAALFRKLPLPGSWVPARVMEQLSSTVFVLEGVDGVRSQARAVVRSLLPFYFPMLQGIIRVLGPSPASLFSRYEDMARLNIKGIRFRYESTSANAGLMLVHYLAHRERPLSSFLTVGCSLEVVYDLCKISGQVGDPEVLGDNDARFRVSW